MHDRRAHWLTPLKRDNMPDAHVVLDTEAVIASKAGRYEHRWACGHTVELHPDDGGVFWTQPGWRWYAHGPMWEGLSEAALAAGKLVVWAHNMPYDLRVSQAMQHLLSMGWRCEAISLARISAWSSWRNGKAKLTVCDSYSWLHVPLDRLAREMRTYPRHSNAVGLPLPALAERCEDDAKVLALAVGRILNLIVREQLGPFRPTGAGQSHAAWRRRWLQPKTVLVHDNDEALAIERQAMHTGRCEAWKWGLQSGTLYEFDLNLAYCRIAAANPLPVKLLGEVASGELASGRWEKPGRTIMAEVDVHTREPLVPTQIDGRVLWPVGQFKTTLWEPELRLLIEKGATMKVKRAWAYTTGLALSPMSIWLIDQLTARGTELDPVERRLFKHWARTLVGRCALRYSQWEYFGRSPWDCLELSFEITPDLKDAIAHLQVGHTHFEQAAEREANNSCPAIPGWVQSRCRVILWELINAAGPENVAYMDTDGLLVTGMGAARLRKTLPFHDDWLLTEKGAHRSVTIHGPRQVEIGADRRIAGLPKNAIRVSEITWDGEMWEGLEAALAAGHHDHVGVMPSTWEITPTDHRREHLPGGATRAWEL